MKVLEINSVCGRGSTGRIATDLADVLAGHGHQCKIAYGRDTVPEQYREIAVQIGSDWDVYLHSVRTRLLDDHGFGSRRATARFLDWVQEYDPDIIHLHNIHGYYINVELLFEYLKQVRKPVVWTLHDCWAFTGHCAVFSVENCEQWKTQCEHCIQKHHYPASLILDRSRRNFRRKRELFIDLPNMTLVTPSYWLAAEVRQSFLKEFPVHVIPNGIDLNIFKPMPSRFREENELVGKQVILGVASIWDSGKGLYDFFEMSKMVGNDQKIVLVGLSKKQIRELPEGILGIQRTNSLQKLAEIYSMADVFVNPTYADNFPTTNLEALACGTPVITYRTGGSPEALDEGCGAVVQKGAENIMQAIRSLNIAADACIQRVTQFEKTVQFEKYLQIYKLFTA